MANDMIQNKGRGTLTKSINLDKLKLQYKDDGRRKTVTADELIKGFVAVDKKVTSVTKEAESLAQGMMALAHYSRDAETFLDACSQIENRAKWGRKPITAKASEKWQPQPNVWRTYKSLINRAMQVGIMPFSRVLTYHYQLEKDKDTGSRTRVIKRGKVGINSFDVLRDCYRATTEKQSGPSLPRAAGVDEHIMGLSQNMLSMVPKLSKTKKEQFEKRLKRLLNDFS